MAANLCILTFLASSLLLSQSHFTTAFSDAPFETSRNYTYVCDAQRFKELGLDINSFAYCNKNLSYDFRAKDLVDRLTLDEKSAQLGDTAVGVPRIGLPKYEWWSEALHGVSNVGQWGSIATFFDKEVPGATSFPCVIHSTASFNETLWKTLGQTVSTEARAMYNLNHAGLTFWSPNINVVRDPRWGRALETPGEDPYVVGVYAANYVRGLQDVEGTENATDLNARPLKVAACCKHYAAYDLDNWLQVDRFHFDAKVTAQDMVETFLKPFEMCVKEGDVSSVMCSYNRVNGIPTCADVNLLKNTVRGKWNLHGYIVSDCDSIEVMVTGHKWLNDMPEEAVAQVLNAGLDLDCGAYYTKYANNSVRLGKVAESEIDSALKNLYIVLLRLGFFDGQPKYDKLDKNEICNEQHIELAVDAARQGVVLLRNDNLTLPLSTNNIKKVAVVGPHANATEAMIGNYAGVPCQYSAPKDGFAQYAQVTYADGCGDILCRNDTTIYQAVQAAMQADATVIVAGLDLSVEREGQDRTDLLLPSYQTQLIQQVALMAKGPVVLVIFSAGGVDITFAKNHPNISAILWAGYPGEEGGRAIADVVFGKYNPGGRLPLTWYYNNYTEALPTTSMPLRPQAVTGYPGRTYKFFNGDVVYPFGYGLSYTNFTYNLTSISMNTLTVKLNSSQYCRDLLYKQGAFKPTCPAVLIDDLGAVNYTVKFEVHVKNVGKWDGNEVVLVYWSPASSAVDAPIKQLVAFKRVFIAAGQSVLVQFELDAVKSMVIVDYKGYTLLPAGRGTLVIGNDVLMTPFEIKLQR